MTKKELMIKAHKMVKEIKNEYSEVDYKFQLGLCLAYLYENEGEVEMVDLKGSEKQVKWAQDIRKVVIEATKGAVEEYEKMQSETFERKGKRSKARDIKIARLNEMVNEFENNDSSKFFIEKYSHFLKIDLISAVNEMMIL